MLSFIHSGSSKLSEKQGRTRREFLADAAKATAAASIAGAAGCFPSVGGKWPGPAPDGGLACTNPDAGPAKAVSPAVVEVMREDALLSGSRTQADPVVVADMLDKGLTALAEKVKEFNAGQSGGQPLESDESNPWKILLPNFDPCQTIGIKVNCLGVVAPSPALVRALIASLRDRLGVDTSKIMVWDRYLIDITGHGKYSDEDRAGAMMYGNLKAGPLEGETVDSPQVTDGIGYGPQLTDLVPQGVPETGGGTGEYARLSRIITDKTNLTINCLSLKTHNVSGITGAIKSVYGIVHNPGEYHKNFNEVAPLLYNIPAVRNSMSLTICDGIIGVISGDPSSKANSTPKRILLGQDPVAFDSYIVDLINQLRAAIGGGPIEPVPDPWLDKAASLGLGTRSYQLVQVT
jgi:hypothetical protein